jgi:ATP-binding cassette subfamily B protein
MVGITAKTLYKIRTDLFEKMERLPVEYFDNNAHGNIMSLYTNDADAIKQMLSDSVITFMLSIIIIIFTYVMMWYYSWQLSIVANINIVFILLISKKIMSGSKKYFKKQQDKLADVNGYIEEMIEGQKVVKVFCHESKSSADFDKINNVLFDVSAKANSYANMLRPVMINLSHVNYAIITVAGAILVIKSIISPGTALAFLQCATFFIFPIAEISQNFGSILTALSGAERIFEVIDKKPEVDNGNVVLVNVVTDKDGNILETNKKTDALAWKEIKENNTIVYTKLKGEIKFGDVVFGYKKGKTTLNKINLEAHTGKKVALVGSTGAGKTTITNLINRFYDVNEGMITLDGIDIKKIKKKELRRMISIVLQDTHLFTGTVIDNIRYGNLDATDDEVIAAAKLANADCFITHLSNGYNTILTSDANNLSQGERQLLAISRAVVANLPILILDEATSSIDTRTEKLIEDGINKLMKGKTVFIIAHRLSTVRNSDTIVVFESGRIIERGNHEELLGKKGRYYRLYNGMFDLE